MWQQHNVCIALRRKAQCDTVETVTVPPHLNAELPTGQPQAQVYERYHSNPTYMLDHPQDSSKHDRLVQEGNSPPPPEC